MLWLFVLSPNLFPQEHLFIFCENKTRRKVATTNKLQGDYQPGLRTA
jgi:hypothetical protein